MSRRTTRTLRITSSARPARGRLTLGGRLAATDFFCGFRRAEARGTPLAALWAASEIPGSIRGARTNDIPHAARKSLRMGRHYIRWDARWQMATDELKLTAPHYRQGVLHYVGPFTLGGH